MQLTSGAMFTSAVGVAAKLGIADLLGNGPMTIDELAQATHARAPRLVRVLRALATVGIFCERPDGAFENTEDSSALRSDLPSSVRHYCMLASGDYYRAFGDLFAAVTTDQPAFTSAFGVSLYDHLARDAAAADVYDRAMEDLTRPVGRHLARSIDFSEALTVVDVGGGNGALLKVLLSEHRHLSGICLDRPHVVERARTASAGETAGRLQFAGGDLFEQMPVSGDVYILKNVLHNWADDQVARILGNIREAIARGDASGRRARLLLIEPLTSAGITMPAVIGELLQMVVCEPGAQRRSEAAFRELLGRLAFTVAPTVMLPTGHGVFECRLREDQ